MTKQDKQKPRIVLAGGSGFLGHLLADYFEAEGWDVVILTRDAKLPKLKPGRRYLAWDGRTLGPWAQELEGARILINLAGATVNCRYHVKNRQRLMTSRIAPTRTLGEAIARCINPPYVWMNASTATIYRHTYGKPWDETGETGADPAAKDAFSIELAQAWEQTFEQAYTPNTRKVTLRTAMVLGKQTNPNNVFTVLKRLVRLGLGGQMGDGRQYVSWIHESDFCRAIAWIANHREISGTINLAAPEPLTNRDMMKLIRTELGIPLGLPAARWMLEAGAFLIRTETELIIKSRRVIPGRLLNHGFRFHFPTMSAAIRNLTGKECPP